MKHIIIKNRLRKIIIAVSIALLFVVLVTSRFTQEKDLQPFLVQAFPEAQSFTKIMSSPLIFDANSKDSAGSEKSIGYVVVTEADAYGGTIQMVTGVNLEGKIVGTAIASHHDTPSFIQILFKHHYLEQFLDKGITDPISLDKDVDGVSGATYSCRGIAKAISIGSHAVARNQFGLVVQDEEVPFRFGAKEMTVLFLMIVMLIGVRFKKTRLKWVTLMGGLVFIGFQYNTPISLSNLAALLMGNFPSIRENLVWYLLLVGIPFITLVVGRNLYCFWLCPFGALQEILAKIGGGRFKCCNKQIEAKASKIKYLLVYFTLCAAFLFNSPGFAGYEPFATLFGLQGLGIQWAILPIVVFASLFIRRFWCRFFCPGLVINETILKFRSLMVMITKKRFNYREIVNQRTDIKRIAKDNEVKE